jgi:hypothetical protein
MSPPKLLLEPSEANAGVFIKRIGWALNGIPIRATFNLVKDPRPGGKGPETDDSAAVLTL